MTSGEFGSAFDTDTPAAPTKSGGGIFDWINGISTLGNTWANIQSANNGGSVVYTAQQPQTQLPTVAQTAAAAQPTVIVTPAAADTKKSNTTTIVLVIVGVLLLAVVMFFLLRKK
jgi:LPXTG-motif cell wall-anchored protein